ncbi:VacB/RNase II family 3'-5' exoribonuclease [Marinimicrobium alkaliphilum]|uniref:VacB/RNase II family 3'-5' exoribonuclease n=1 Tax=Marinimicrobium alkaliphilum TaxID=2202654 RepID=UPI000DB9251A|nr:VacB/RNase II family 3'-5' exoribonuclease [Marinimicrobium alkaliphilum]
MLNSDALQQLSQLKTDIRSERDLAQGLVRGTTKRFGFVRLDDGRDAFLNPEQMQRVLPGDRVEVALKTNARDQLEAELERLLETELDTFVGRYMTKGQAHFVEPDLPFFNRWMFVPPRERAQCAEGDLVLCQLLRHPYKNEGKTQVKILERIGRSDEPGIEGRYIVAKHQLPHAWSDAASAQSHDIQAIEPSSDEAPEDLSTYTFVTIDAESTRDMDDAVYVEPRDDGWHLITAIADPTRYIPVDSPLGETARTRASTAYLLGHTLTMLPPELSHDTFSLVPEQRRPALLCHMDIASDGSITDCRFREGIVCSHYKLSYQGVTDLIEGTSDYDVLPDAIKEMLRQLHELALLRTEYRREHALVMDDRADYFHQLNDQRKIERIDKRERNLAHRIVEEAMLATNICAGELLAQYPGYGIFSTHAGFRSEQLEEIQSLLDEDLPEQFENQDFGELSHFQQLMRQLREHKADSETHAALLALLQRKLQPGELSLTPAPHFGLGFRYYATVTSPIRRYNDFHNHLAIKAILRKHSGPSVDDEAIAALQAQLMRGRQACRQLEQWLCCQYLADHIGSVHTGRITQVNASGIGVRLDDSGIEGFVMLKKREKSPDATPKKLEFDARRLTLSTPEQRFRLDETVAVMVAEVDVASRRVSLELVDEATAERLKVWQEADLPKDA